MSLFDLIFSKKEVKAAQNATGYFRTLTAYKPVFRTWRGAIYESELVRSAIDARARHISKLKIEIIGSAKPTLQTQLRLAPNRWQTWSQFLYRTSTILDVNNTACIVPVLDKNLNTTGYFTVLPNLCEPVEFEGEIYLRYKFNSGEVGAVELSRCVILTKFQYKDDLFGSSNRALNETMKLDYLQKQGISEAIKNSATYRFSARLNNFVKHDDLVLERERFSEDNFSSEAEGGGLLLFPNTYTDIKQLENKPYTVDESQLAAIRTNVYNYFGVNEKILQNIASGDEWAAFYEGAIEVFAIQLSEGMTKSIFSDRERANGSLIMATANRLQYMSNADKMSFTNNGLDRGMISINEAREVWNLPPVDGGEIRTIRGEYKNTETIEGEE